ncbi:MAG: hypothetical protein AAFR11_01685 [Pseudomonadota bacterium]
MPMPDGFSIHRVAVAGRSSMCVVLLVDDLARSNVQHSVPLIYENGRLTPLVGTIIVPWLVAGAASLANDLSRHCTLLGWGGQTLHLTPTAAEEGALSRADGPVSVMRTLRQIEGALYAVGMNRQVYQGDHSGSWVSIDDGVSTTNFSEPSGFEAIDGLSASDIVCVGVSGECYRRQKDVWIQLETGTNVHLHSVCALPGGRFLAGGRKGVLVLIDENGAELIETPFEEPIWDLFRHRDLVFGRSGDTVFTIAKHREIVSYVDVTPYGEVRTIGSSDHGLFVFTDRELFEYHNGELSPLDYSVHPRVQAAELVELADQIGLTD